MYWKTPCNGDGIKQLSCQNECVQIDKEDIP